MKQVCYDKWCDENKDCYDKYNLCHNSNQSYVIVESQIPFDGPKYGLSGEVCSDDPHFYQVCDMRFEVKITNNEILCEFYWCTINTMTLLTPALASMGKILCNGKNDCRNTDIDEKGCSDDAESVQPNRQKTPHITCDGKCDITSQECADEAVCNGYTYGMFCEKKLHYTYQFLAPSLICNKESNCRNGEDEKICEVTETTKDTCLHAVWNHIVPVYNFTRCLNTEIIPKMSHTWQYCQNAIFDQTNCTDIARVGVRCQVNGYQSTVSKYMSCQNKDTICDDNFENLCVALSKTCFVHKSSICDQTDHCLDRADETDSICGTMTKETCIRRGGNAGNITMPLAWLQDRVQDCVDGRDEMNIWPTCGKDKTFRIVQSGEVCEDAFVCPWNEPGYVELANLCDGIETCGNENQICFESRASKEIEEFVFTSNKGLSKQFSYCLPGIDNIRKLKGDMCFEESFIFPDNDFFGVDTKTFLQLPVEKRDCDHMYGEQYLYTSCTNKCINSSCPLETVPRYEVCPNQYPERIGTIANNEYLVFFTNPHETIYSNSYFVCKNKIKCIDYSQVCDLVKDCGDGSDEAACTNHFQCMPSGDFIPKTQVCNGLFDCMDLSDECNKGCSTEILEGVSLKILTWIIGILAIFANLGTIVSNLGNLKRCKTSVAVVNKSLVILIALGDSFLGCYLFIISIYDGVVFKHSYCRQQIDWKASTQCSAIGVLCTVGSQLSLFSMTGLSIVRVYGINKSMRISGELTLKKGLVLMAGVIWIVSASAAIALVPIIKTFEDFYVNGVKFDERLQLFIGTVGKQKIFNVLEAYYGQMKLNVLSWENINEMVNRMFSHDGNEDIFQQTRAVGFYGNDGVCLFKYFVQKDDPQRNFVWSILALNFACFLFISLSYVSIGLISSRSSRSLMKSKTNKKILKRNQRMNRKIFLIITTDFICWIPFIIICIFHSLGILDATPWYSLFSMIILPINSVINPFLFDSTLTSSLRKLLKHISNTTMISIRGRELTVSQQEIAVIRPAGSKEPIAGLPVREKEQQRSTSHR